MHVDRCRSWKVSSSARCRRNTPGSVWIVRPTARPWPQNGWDKGCNGRGWSWCWRIAVDDAMESTALQVSTEVCWGCCYISNLKGLEGISCDTCPVNLIHESHFSRPFCCCHLPARASAAGCHPYRPWQSPKKRHCNRSRREVRPGSEPVWCRVTCSFIFHEI
jgi:hypothetical protein